MTACQSVTRKNLSYILKVNRSGPKKPERIIINTNHSYHHIHLPKSFLTDLMIQIQFKPIQQNKTSC